MMMRVGFAVWLLVCCGLGWAGESQRVYNQLDYRLSLGGQHFDPLNEPHGLPPAWQASASQGNDLHLIQFQKPLRAHDLDQLRSMGLEPVTYIFPLTYVVWGTVAARSRAAREPLVRWSGYFQPGYRLLPEFRGLNGSALMFRALVYRGSKRNQLQRQLQDAGGQRLEWRVLNHRLAVVRFSTASAALAQISRIPGILSLQPVPTDGGVRDEMSAQLLAAGRDMGGIIQPGYVAWLSGLGLSGQGVVMAVVDNGVDGQNADLSGRELACSGEACAGGTVSDHGTHVAGNGLGSGNSNVLDGFGFLRGLGLAPAANYVDLLQVNHEKPGGMLALMTDAVRHGGVISNNSWGASSQALGYDMDTLWVDVGVRDADPVLAGYQPLTYVLAVNNGNGQFQSQGTPDEAKNVIAVGATTHQKTLGGQADDIDDLASVTAHGPARDGRFLPHLVAPGCQVDGLALQGMFALRCGTSFAAPQVSGAAALFIEAHRKSQALLGPVIDPSPALVKAALLASAENLAGNRDAIGLTLGHRPDNKQGWGRPELVALLGEGTEKYYYDAPVVFAGTGDVWAVPLAVVDPSQPALLTLVWTDAPGHGLGGATPAWNNDLDLEASYQGQSYVGNQVGVDGWSQAGGMADFRNNSEGIWFGPMASGAVDVRVRASNLVWDGLPQQGSLTDQDFALVATNLAERETFRILAANQSPGLCSSAGTSLPLNFQAFGGFADTVTLSLMGLPANLDGQFSQATIVPPGNLQLSFTPIGLVAAGVYPIQISGMSVADMQTIEVILTVFDQVPGLAATMVPGHLSNEHDLEPVFVWQAATQAQTYQIQLAEDVDFNKLVFELESTDLSLDSALPLRSFTRYFWRVRAMNPCGEGAWSPSARFRTRWVPPILLVDDDGDAPDVRAIFTQTLDSLNQNYDIWDTQNSTSEPLLEDLNRYQMVIWFSGAATNFSDPKAGPTELSEIVLAAFLDGGGCLFISSQEYLYDRGGPTHNVPTAFMKDYLGVDVGISDVDQTSVMGEGPVFGSIGMQLLGNIFPNQSDRLSPAKGASLAFSGDMGDAAVSKQTPIYQSHYFGFSFAALEVAAREVALSAILLACPFVIRAGCLRVEDLLTQADGWPTTVNIQDLLGCLDQFSGKRR